ncbi:14412_t:CDS:2, partial [Entrophospora sp. SA101]
VGALFLAALVANCFLGALPPVDLRAVCLVRKCQSIIIVKGQIPRVS